MIPTLDVLPCGGNRIEWMLFIISLGISSISIGCTFEPPDLKRLCHQFQNHFMKHSLYKKFITFIPHEQS